MSTRIPTREVLRSLGFGDDSSLISESPGDGLSFDFGNCKLAASFCTNMRFQPIVFLHGTLVEPGAMAVIECEMPQEVESREQGAAWVVWCLDQYASGRRFEPTRSVAWLDYGREHRSLLPWERQRQAYEARPRCLVDRDWARLAIRKLVQAAATLTPKEPISLHFDGELLRISWTGNVIACTSSRDCLGYLLLNPR